MGWSSLLWTAVTCLGILTLLAACTEGPGPETATPPPVTRLVPVASPSAQIRDEVTVPVSPTIPLPASAGLQELVVQAREDLASRLSIPTEQVDLLELSAVVWPDGALGCPQPGVAYTQVPQEGLRIRLRAGKRIYPYHGGGGTPPFLCEQAIEDENRQ